MKALAIPAKALMTNWAGKVYTAISGGRPMAFTSGLDSRTGSQLPRTVDYSPGQIKCNRCQSATATKEKPTTNMQPIPHFRIGIGHDTHRLKPGGPLRLGGVDIPFEQSLDGHSDADVLLHAVTDAILGAAAMGDIGELFPDTAPENKGRDSAELLLLAMQQVAEQGYQIVNLDCIVFAQKPKLSAFKRPIAHRIAEILQISPAQVGIKAKTGEGVGAVGQQQAMMAQCVALLNQIR